ncbi:hypothetical protein ABKV19_026998 [Rosa sericea]
MHLEFGNLSLHSSEFGFECANLVVLLHNILLHQKAGMNIYSRASAEGKRVQIGGRQYIDIPGRYIYTQHLKGSKAWVKASTWIPIFDVGDEFDAGTLSRKIMGFTYYGYCAILSLLTMI